MTFYIILALSSFLISLLGTRMTILVLRKRNAYRQTVIPGQPLPTHKGGGIAVVFAMLICLMIADVSYGIVLSLLMLTAVSLLDDLIKVHTAIKLLVQLMAVSIPLSMLQVPVFSEELPLWLDRSIAGFLWLWFINLFTFMDSSDGISPTEMICVSLGLCLISIFNNTFPDALSTYSLIVFSVGCGFLWWNWHPAKIYMGEVGSVPVGFFMGYLILLAVLSGYGYAAMILPAYYLADGSITIISRLMKRKRIWASHSEHYHQIAIKKGMRTETAVKFVFGVNLLLILLAVIATMNPEIAMLEAGVAYMCVFMVMGFFAYDHTIRQPENTKENT